MKLPAFLVTFCLMALYLKVAKALTPLNGTLFQSTFVSDTQDQAFLIEDAQYLAVTSDPIFTVSCVLDPSQGPLTYISALSSTTTGDELQKVIEDSLVKDDVFVQGFLNNVLVSASGSDELDDSVISYLEGQGSNIIYGGGDGPSTCGNSTLPLSGRALTKVLRMYIDTYRKFVTGTYESNGGYKAFTQSEADWGYAMIPVPSRLYSTDDTRPMAGQRVAVKDIYDLEGIQTTAGSRAYAAVNDVASKTAPALQQIIDLGGVVVGKQKTAQFASPQSPWNWNDAFYPRSPRGDTFLSCSGSSSGAGCSIAAYDWLNFAIGTDTGLSMRQPAAFSGTYGNRPSQGMILMENIITNAFCWNRPTLGSRRLLPRSVPATVTSTQEQQEQAISPLQSVIVATHDTRLVSFSTCESNTFNADTAGVFCRDPVKWASFAKAWYDPSLHQDTSLNGLSALSVSDDRTFPKRILYPVDHLPLQNPAAETIFQKFLSDASAALGATVEKVNLTETIEDVTGRPILQLLGDLLVLWTHDLITETAQPLLAQYAPAFSPLDEPYRGAFHSLTVDDNVYKAAMTNRTRDAALWHEKALFSTDTSCSEAIFVYDVGTGGIPTFRSQDLNSDPGSTTPVNPTTPQAGSTVASYFGDADYTIPIGQVSYFSNVTFQDEIMPVTVNLVAKRGCDFVLFNLVNDLADKGILKTVSTGQQAFAS
ncbi:amidase [Colletotrichum phormii]|uniref:Amidase n=1 Tax=Colletotrichum phormii TaxID=359342 RepID=A0AAJ0EF56_9PEZI|nr:amidase [Colletotrichum phormii]KAK1637807.1 amidase [Colletotrichum phormii]